MSPSPAPRSRALVRAGALVATWLALPLAAAGCGELGTMLYGDHTGLSRRPQPPEVRLVSARLSHAPTNAQLGAHFCVRQATRAGGRMAAAACRALGPLPSRDELRFVFDLELEAQNPGRVALPVVEALLAIRLFPGTDGEQLGAACVSLCRDRAQCPQDRATACQSDEATIHDLESFAAAAPGLLASIATGEQRFDTIMVRTIDPGETLHFSTSFALDVEAALSVIEWGASEAIASAERGQAPTFAVPYELEGTLFADVEGVGRFAGSFRASRGTWTLE